MSKKNKATKIMAVFALFGIIIGIVGTGIMIIIGGGNSATSKEQSLTAEQYQELQELIKSQGGTGVINNTGTISDTGSKIVTGTIDGTGSITLSGSTK